MPIAMFKDENGRVLFQRYVAEIDSEGNIFIVDLQDGSRCPEAYPNNDWNIVSVPGGSSYIEKGNQKYFIKGTEFRMEYFYE